jgi:Flp pilus assembly protein TadD
MAATGNVKRELSLEETVRLALQLHEAGRDDQALSVIQQVIDHVPDCGDAWNVLGIIKCHRSEHPAAIEAFDKALAIQDVLMWRSNRAMAMCQLGQREEAAAVWQECVKADPNNPIYWNNLGNTLELLERFEEALAAHDKTLQLDPDHVLTYFNRAIVLARLCRHDEAIANFNAALSRKPSYPDALYNRGLSKLHLGDLPGGFVDLEHRFRSELAVGRFRMPSFEQPQWNGRASLDGRSILIHGEQGIGDMIMIMRYLPMIVEKGARVYMVVHKPLKPLVDVPGVELLQEGPGNEYPKTDYWLPAMSLPMVFKTSITTIPQCWSPKPLAPLMDEWKARLNGLGLYHNRRVKVGLCWSGNPHHKQDHNRSIPFALLEPLLKVKAEFVSFQKDMRPGDRIAFESKRGMYPRLWDVSDHLTDLRETAHALAFMDVVITVDTAIAHLAGTLRKETWLLIAKNGSDWRWMHNRDTTPWYPRMTLYRQVDAPNQDWPSLLSRVASDLKSHAARYY